MEGKAGSDPEATGESKDLRIKRSAGCEGDKLRGSQIGSNREIRAREGGEFRGTRWIREIG